MNARVVPSGETSNLQSPGADGSLRQPASLQRVEEYLVDAKGPGISFPITDENRLGVTSPGDVSAGRRYLAFASAKLRHGEHTLSIPDEGDAVSIGGPGRVGSPNSELLSIAEALHSRRLSHKYPSDQPRRRPTRRRRRGRRPGTTAGAASTPGYEARGSNRAGASTGPRTARHAITAARRLLRRARERQRPFPRVFDH